MGNRKTRVGRVVSSKMDKTVVVAVEWRSTHRLYGKGVRRTTRLYVHDEANQCQVGDMVRIEEARPLSRLKRWRVIHVLNRSTLPQVAPEELEAEEAEADETETEETQTQDEEPASTVAEEPA